MIHVPTDRTPTHPGEMLLEEFLIPMEITQRKLANAIHVPYQRINDLVKVLILSGENLVGFLLAAVDQQLEISYTMSQLYDL